jgi:hypothetical protein
MSAALTDIAAFIGAQSAEIRNEICRQGIFLLKIAIYTELKRATSKVWGITWIFPADIRIVYNSLLVRLHLVITGRRPPITAFRNHADFMYLVSLELCRRRQGKLTVFSAPSTQNKSYTTLE